LDDNHPYQQDATRVQRSLDGDMAAFDEIMREHQETVFRVAMRFVKNEVEAQDVAQDAFLNVFRKLHTFKGDAALGSWIYRIAVNTSLMRLRKRRRRGEVALENVAPSEEHESEYHDIRSNWHLRGDEVAENRELRQKILEAVESLEPKYQGVFVLKEFEGYSLQEIADEMDLSVPAVKSRLHRARLHLRTLLERYVNG
jgi:RNA polymerase sigma-70 factor (ECF subfamily)